MRYLPTSDGAAAGGDFYDALELTGGRVGIAVGDVVGHGPEAAAAMGQLRGALRAYALEGRSPARVLQLLSRYADGVPGARGATVAYAVIDPAAREVRYAVAGHPPPLLLVAGRVDPVPGPRARRPLDRALGHVYVDAAAPVPEGATLILYSDGAIERRGETLDAGLERLLGRGRGRRPAPSPRRWRPGWWRRCWTARSAPTTSRCSSRACAGPTLTPLRLWFSARADQLAVVREAMRGWLASADVDRGDAEMLVLAAGELCANAVEHAYPGEGKAPWRCRSAAPRAGSLALVVRDRGRWRPPPADPGMRGRGLRDRARADDGWSTSTKAPTARPSARGTARSGFVVELPPPGPALVELERSGEAIARPHRRRDRRGQRGAGRGRAGRRWAPSR